MTDEPPRIRILRNIRRKAFPLDVQCALLIVLSLAAVCLFGYLAAHCFNDVACQIAVLR